MIKKIYKIKLVISMKVRDAISKKILCILDERDITVNKLATICCLTQSTVDSLVNGKSKNPKLLTIIRICDGLGITLKEFFDDPMFLNLERED